MAVFFNIERLFYFFWPQSSKTYTSGTCAIPIVQIGSVTGLFLLSNGVSLFITIKETAHWSIVKDPCYHNRVYTCLCFDLICSLNVACLRTSNTDPFLPSLQTLLMNQFLLKTNQMSFEYCKIANFNISGKTFGQFE